MIGIRSLNHGSEKAVWPLALEDEFHKIIMKIVVRGLRMNDAVAVVISLTPYFALFIS